MFYDQTDYAIRFEWGVPGIDVLAACSDVVIIVDVLSFSTCVDIATARGAVILPYQWRNASAETYARDNNALLASQTRRFAGEYSLAPTSLLTIKPGTRLATNVPMDAPTLWQHFLATLDLVTPFAALRASEVLKIAVDGQGMNLRETGACRPQGHVWSVTTMPEPRMPSMFVAVYLLLLSNGQVLLLRRHNTGYEDGNYSVIAGHVERDERVTAALVREAAEEAGIELAEADVQCVHVMQRTGSDGRVYVDFFFLAEDWEGHVHNGEPSKCDDLRWFPLTALPTNTIPYIRDVLHKLHAGGLGFSEYGWDGRGGAS